MNKMSMILSAILLGGMVIFYAPNIFALNRGHILRNIALWLAIFAGLGLIYQNFGPGSPHPMFSTPVSRAGGDIPASPVQPPASTDSVKPATEKPAQEDGFTPPRED
jgi:hypothetical protein